MDIGVATWLGVGGAGIAACSTLDRIIDVTSHDHRTLAYRLTMKPSAVATKVALGAGVALAGVGLLAGTRDDTRHLREPMLKVAAGIGAGLLAPVAVRAGWGLMVAPAHAGWRPGAQALPHWRLDDLAANAVDRVHMMGREPELAGRNWNLINRISQWQGHGPLLEREAAGEFAPVLRFQGVQYRTQLRHPVELVD